MPLFTPEEKKIFDQEVESVKQGMLDNKRALVSKYGKDAEKIIQGRAVKQALKKIENLRQNQEMENNKLKEMVKNALTKPLKEQDVEVRADIIGNERELSKMMNLLDDFESKLKSHDWYYMMSDDNRAYKKGSDEETDLKSIAAQLYNGGYGKEAEELYNTYNKFKNNTFEDFISSFKSLYEKEEMQMEDLDLGHEDNEPHDLKSQLYCIGKSAMELYQMVDSFEGKGEVDFPSWWQNKINTAKNMIGSAKSYLEFELKEPQIDDMVGVAQSEDITNMAEKKLTKPELKKREEIVKAMKKDFKGPEPVMYAIATKKAKKVAEELAKKLKEARFKKGEDVGEPGKGFSKIAKSAAKQYGSEEAGKRVAGAILKKVLKK